MSRAIEIADMAHETRHTLVTDEEWYGWMWYLHDRIGQCPAGGSDGEAARIVITRDDAARSRP